MMEGREKENTIRRRIHVMEYLVTGTAGDRQSGHCSALVKDEKNNRQHMTNMPQKQCKVLILVFCYINHILAIFKSKCLDL